MEPNDLDERLSRRDAMQSVAGLVAVPVLLAGGLTSAQEKNMEPKSELRNPRDLYPKPPFKRQHQEPPGLASKMEPRPDHGEKSYKGSGRLSGRKALITGGDPLRSVQWDDHRLDAISVQATDYLLHRFPPRLVVRGEFRLKRKDCHEDVIHPARGAVEVQELDTLQSAHLPLGLHVARFLSSQVFESERAVAAGAVAGHDRLLKGVLHQSYPLLASKDMTVCF
jgi:hypothetical protein